MASKFTKSSILFTVIGEEILNIQFVVVILTILLVIYFWRKHSELKEFLPVPWNLPVVGSLPWLIWSLVRARLPVYEFMRRLRYTYGSVYAFNICGNVVVILNDFQAVKKAMDSPYVSDRPTLQGPTGKFGIDKGLVLASGHIWAQQRKFTQATFRSFGIGTKSFEDKIVLESHALIKELPDNFNDTVFDPEHAVVNAVSNIICAVVFGKRFDYADKKFCFFQNLAKQQTEIGRDVFPEMFLPILSYLPSKKRDKLIQGGIDLRSFVDEIINEHKVDFDPNHLRDYIDVYLNEFRLKEEGLATKVAKLDKENMLHTIAQLFTAGTDTTTQTIRWGLTFLVAYPDIQTRVQKEIDEVVGRDRLPKLSDKASLPYMCATIFEIQRMTHTRLSVPHRCTKAISVAGVTIPEDAIVVANVFAAHRDPDFWTDPNNFKPERFIDEKGEVYQPEELIPFNTGRRICLGDKLARMELFIFLSHLLHQFTFEPPSSSDKYPVPGIGANPANPLMRVVKRD